MSLAQKGSPIMTRQGFAANPFLLGFEQIDRMVERTQKSEVEGYPPCNIEMVSENAYRVSLAVAGFAEADLSVTLEGRRLVIRGRQAENAHEQVFLHRGIAARAFQRSFVLAEGVEVEKANLENGLLHVDLCRRSPEVAVQKIVIGGNG